MSFSYSGDPAGSDLDATRYFIPDKVDVGHRVEDEEINFLLANFGGPIHAAAIAVEALAGEFADRASKTVGKLKIEQGNIAKAFAARGELLRSMIGTDLAQIFVGGLKISEKLGLDTAQDDVQPSFAVGQDDHPGTGAALNRFPPGVIP